MTKTEEILKSAMRRAVKCQGACPARASMLLKKKHLDDPDLTERLCHEVRVICALCWARCPIARIAKTAHEEARKEQMAHAIKKERLKRSLTGMACLFLVCASLFSNEMDFVRPARVRTKIEGVYDERSKRQ